VLPASLLLLFAVLHNSAKMLGAMKHYKMLHAVVRLGPPDMVCADLVSCCLEEGVQSISEMGVFIWQILLLPIIG
jgi:hypothetical protein